MVIIWLYNEQIPLSDILEWPADTNSKETLENLCRIGKETRQPKASTLSRGSSSRRKNHDAIGYSMKGIVVRCR